MRAKSSLDVAVLTGGKGAEKISGYGLLTPSMVITVGELCLGSMGLSQVSTLSAPRSTALWMDGRLVFSTAIGITLSGLRRCLWGIYEDIWTFFLNDFLASGAAAGRPSRGSGSSERCAST